MSRTPAPSRCFGHTKVASAGVVLSGTEDSAVLSDFKYTCHCRLGLLLITLTQPDGVGGGAGCSCQRQLWEMRCKEENFRSCKPHEVLEGPEERVLHRHQLSLIIKTALTPMLPRWCGTPPSKTAGKLDFS